jgi:hypothetical protein
MSDDIGYPHAEEFEFLKKQMSAPMFTEDDLDCVNMVNHSGGILPHPGITLQKANVKVASITEENSNLRAFVDLVLWQQRSRGYPTSPEWMSIIEVAKNEKARIEEKK